MFLSKRKSAYLLEVRVSIWSLFLKADKILRLDLLKKQKRNNVVFSRYINVEHAYKIVILNVFNFISEPTIRLILMNLKRSDC